MVRRRREDSDPDYEEEVPRKTRYRRTQIAARTVHNTPGEVGLSLRGSVLRTMLTHT
jgi:hypothetical protein